MHVMSYDKQSLTSAVFPQPESALKQSAIAAAKIFLLNFIFYLRYVPEHALIVLIMC